MDFPIFLFEKFLTSTEILLITLLSVSGNFNTSLKVHVGLFVGHKRRREALPSQVEGVIPELELEQDEKNYVVEA